jgi:hypothetical protein
MDLKNALFNADLKFADADLIETMILKSFRLIKYVSFVTFWNLLSRYLFKLQQSTGKKTEV